MKASHYSRILVYLQFFCLAWLLLNGRIFSENLPLLLVQILSLLLGITAVVVMKLPNISIFPEPKENAEFVQSGPYALVRNPMYLSILLFFGAQLAAEFDEMRLIVFLVLLVVLNLKIRIEEEVLCEVFDGYEAYMNRTKRLIPYVY